MIQILLVFLIGQTQGFCEFCVQGFCNDESNSYCSKCEKLYVSVDGKCQSCWSICDTCSKDGVCANCPKGYFGDINQCQSCSPKCLQCQSKNQCEKCEKHYYLDQAQCFECSINCLNCAGASASCTSCYDGYLLSSSQNCELCSSPCNTCIDQAFYCTSCISNQFYLSGKQCLPCQFPCIECQNESQCIKCQLTYYLNESSRCNKCQKPCYQCLNQSQCIDCINENYYENNGQCFACNNFDEACLTCKAFDFCTKCQDGYFIQYSILQPSQTKCIACPPKCLTCQSESLCIECNDKNINFHYFPNCESKCEEGYFLLNEKCLYCNFKCKTCIDSFDNCLQCQENRMSPPTCNCEAGYFEDEYVCKRCKIQCLTCLNEKICITCQNGLFNQDGECISECGSQYLQKLELVCLFCGIENCVNCLVSGICSNCQSNYLLQNNKCYYQHCAQGYFTQDNMDCQSCNANCKNCHEKAENCIECQQGEYLVLKVENNICLKCNPICDTCVSWSLCTSCIQSYYLLDESCINECPLSHYSIGQMCYKCTQNCLTCYNEKCSECDKSTILFQDQCINRCPQGFYFENNQCFRCNSICKACIDYVNCESCQSPYFLQENNCLTFCPNQYYGDIMDNKCKNCIDGCEICSNNNSCYKCLPDFVFFQNACVSQCDQGYYVEASYCRECHIYCKTCQGPTEYDCLTCKNNLLRYKTMCLQECPKFTVLINTVCKQCYETCQTCIDSGQFDCITCKSTYAFLNGECFAFCPSQYYRNQQNCLKCQNNCDICKSNISCIKCQNNYYYDSQNCISQCIDGYYGYDGLCEKCHISCLTCNGKLSINCLTCAQPLVFYQNECLSGCLNQFYQSNDFQCKLCKSECSACINDTLCTQCPYNTYFLNYTCIVQCPEGYIHNYIKRRCDQCSVGCKTCFGISGNQCLSCFDGYLYFLNTCNQNCPQTSYKSSQECLPCQSNCISCLQEQECYYCKVGYFLFGRQCFKDCPNGYFKYLQMNECNQCIENCEICEQFTQRCQVCKQKFFLNAGQCVQYFNSYQINYNNYYDPKLQECVKHPVSVQIHYVWDSYSSDKIEIGFCLAEESTYPDIQQNVCSKCHSACKYCYGPKITQCMDCYMRQDPITYQETLNCHPICQQEQFLVYWENEMHKPNQICGQCRFGCVECLSDSWCETCLNLSYNSMVGKCLNTCQDGQFPNYRSIYNIYCRSCDTNCLTCVTTMFNCTSCNPPKALFNSQCVSNCPFNYYLSYGDNACYPCKLSCSTCQDSFSCISPATVYELVVQDSQVYANCDDGYYLDGKICQKCLNNCVRCENNQSCTACNSNFHLLYNNLCIEKCPNKKYFDNGKCQSCDSSCLTCIDSQNKSCLSCSSNLYFIIQYNQSDNEYYSYCKQLCPQNYILDTNNKVCLYKSCVSSCDTCMSNQPQFCVTCYAGQVLQLILTSSGYLQYGYCESQCQNDHYLYDEKCYKCNRLCQECSDYSNYCSVCSSLAYRLNNQQCVVQCPLGFLTNKNTRTCDQCSSGCLECILHNNENICMVQKIEQCDNCFYLHENQCKPCHYTCLTCDGPSQYSCLSCGKITVGSQEEYRYQYGNTCVFFCPEGSSMKGNSCQLCSNNCQTCNFDYGSEYCTKCYKQEYLFKNYCIKCCPEKYFQNDFLQACEPCFEGCKICYSSRFDTCMICENNFYFSKNNTCLPYCPYRYYFDLPQRECLECNKLIIENGCITSCPPGHYQQDIYCFKCTTQCTSCEEGLFLLKQYYQSKCVVNCPQGYFIQNNACQKCDEQCLACITQANNCLICVENTIGTPPKCEYIMMYTIDHHQPYFVKCDQKCLSCSQYYNNCLICQSDRIQNPPYCTCPLGTYDDGIKCIKCNHECDDCLTNQLCLHCRGDRVGENCQCRIGMYDDQINQYCQNCNFTCSTCTINGCTLCRGNRQMSINDQCLCPIGYYEDNEAMNCPKCLFKCQICIQYEYNCQICLGNRKNPPQCICDDGYFDDEVNLDCQTCPKECVTCNKASCLICKTNRFGSVCDCPPGGIDRQNVDYMECETCDLGTPIITLQNDLITLIVEFGRKVKFSIDEGCSQVYQIDQLGVDPDCYVDEQFRIIITLGINNKIEIGMEMQLLTNIIGLDCQQPFKQILPTKLLPPQIIPNSDIFIFGPPQTTKCEEVTFYVGQFFNDGRKGFKMIQWSLNSQVQSNTNDHLEGILIEANFYKNKSVTIQPFILEEDQTYQFKYEFINYQSQTQFKLYTLKCVSSQLPLIQLQYQDEQPLVQYINNRISFKAIFKFQPNCDSIALETDAYYKVIIQSENRRIKESEYQYKSILQNFVDIIIESYSILNQGYFQVIVEASHDKMESSQKSLYLNMLKPGAQLNIQGGNQLHTYSKTLFLDAIFKNLDSPNSIKEDIDFRWTCINLASNDVCKDSNNKVITFTDGKQQIIPKLSLNAYQSYQFTISVHIEGKKINDSIIVSVVDYEVGQLKVEAKNINLNKEILFNQDIDFKMNDYYQQVSGSLIQNFQQINSFKINYKEFTINLQKYLAINIEQITVKFQGMDSNNFLPLFASLELKIQKPPKNCKFTISTETGIAYQTIFLFQVNKCVDLQTPLKYKFQYYFNQRDYEQDILSGESKHSELLIDYQISTHFTSILPPSTYSYSILIASVKNNYGAEINMTAKAVVGLNIQDIEKKQKSILMDSKIQHLKQKFPRILQETQEQKMRQQFIEIYSNSSNIRDEFRVSVFSILSIGLVDCNYDKTKNVSDFARNVFIKSNQDLDNPLFSEVTKFQIQKSMNRLMERIDISDSTEINMYLNQIQNQLANDIEKINNLGNVLYLNQASYQDFELRKQYTQNIYNYLNAIDTISNTQNQILYEIQQDNQLGKEKILQDQMRENNQFILKQIQLVKYGALYFQQINEEPIYFKGQSFNLILNRLTPDYLIKYTNNLDLTFDGNNSLGSDIILNFSNINYSKNSFILDELFPQNILYTQVQSYEPILPNGSILIPQQPFLIQFKLNQNQERLLQQYQDLYLLNEQPYEAQFFCTNKLFQQWESGFCSSLIEQQQQQELIINCKCNRLGPTTVGSQLNDIISIEKYSKQIPQTDLLTSLNFPIQQSIILYYLIIFTATLIVSIPFGFKKDKMDQEKLMSSHFIESEYNRVINEDKMKKDKTVQIRIHQLINQGQEQNEEVIQVKGDENEIEHQKIDPQAFEFGNGQQNESSSPQVVMPNQYHLNQQKEIFSPNEFSPKLESPIPSIQKKSKMQVLIEKENFLIKRYFEEKLKKLQEDRINIKFSNAIGFVILFSQIGSLIKCFDKQLTRPIRLCIVYVTILSTCSVNIYFEVDLTASSTIKYSIFSWFCSYIEILVLSLIIQSNNKLSRFLGELILLIISVLFLFYITISIKNEPEHQENIQRSNSWGINSIISFIITYVIIDPLISLLYFFTFSYCINNRQCSIQKIFHYAFTYRKLYMFMSNMKI